MCDRVKNFCGMGSLPEEAVSYLIGGIILRGQTGRQIIGITNVFQDFFSLKELSNKADILQKNDFFIEREE